MNPSLRFSPAIFLAFALLTACSGEKEKKITPATVKVTVREIQPAGIGQQLVYSGTIEPDNTAQIGFAVPGIVNQVAVEEGQFVKEGQLLAAIDATEYIQAHAIASAGLEQAEDLYARLEGLYNKGSLPAKDYIDIKTKLAQAKANRDINAKRIADSRLHAPMSGIVSAKLIERGSTAAPGVPAFTIIKTDQVYARISVPESEVGQISRNMPATVFIPTLNDSITGRITIINPQAEASSRSYAVKIQLRNERQQLLPGMLTRVQINTGRNIERIVIPATAVVRDADDLLYVFVVNPQNKAIRKRIFAGAITGREEIIVTEGLQAGDRLVTAGQTKLKDGVTVTY